MINGVRVRDFGVELSPTGTDRRGGPRTASNRTVRVSSAIAAGSTRWLMRRTKRPLSATPEDRATHGHPWPPMATTWPPHGHLWPPQLHLFQKRVLSYRVMLATKWRLPPRIETSAQRAPRRPESVKGPGGRSTRPDNTRPAGQAFLTEMSQSCRGVRIRLDFCRKGRIAMCAGRWIPAR